MQGGRLVLSVCLFITSIAATGFAQISTEEATVRVTYAKATIAHQVDTMKAELAGRKPAARPGDFLHVAISNVHVGPIQEILNNSIESLFTKPAGLVVNGDVGPAEIPGDSQSSFRSLKAESWKVAPYLGEDWKVPFSEVVNQFDVQYSRFASFEVRLTLLGHQRQYQAMFLFGTDASGTPRVFGIDHILGMNIINQLLVTKVEDTVLALQKNFGNRESVNRLVRSLQPEAGCEVDASSGFCCHSATGHCGLKTILAPTTAPVSSALPFGISGVAPAAVAASCSASCSSFNSNEFGPAASGGGDSTQHFSGSHTGSASAQGFCTYSGSGLPCFPSCHVSVTGVTTNDSGLPSGWCHLTASNWAFSDGQNSCTGTAGWGAAACPFCLCGLSISVSASGGGASASVSGTGSAIWAQAGTPHNWTCDTIR